MGLFSWDCKFCGHPLIMPGNAESNNRWMSDAVALLPNGDVLMGTYDGYGRVDGMTIHEGGEPEVYHAECWKAAGVPPKFTGSSRNAVDQGHFYSEGVHNSPPPGSEGFFKADKERPRSTSPKRGTKLAHCQNCDWTGELKDTPFPKHIHERVAPGEIMPAGECPKCGAFVHLGDPKKHKVIGSYTHRHGADILSFTTSTPVCDLDAAEVCEALKIEFEPERGEHIDFFTVLGNLEFPDIDKEDA